MPLGAGFRETGALGLLLRSGPRAAAAEITALVTVKRASIGAGPMVPSSKESADNLLVAVKSGGHMYVDRETHPHGLAGPTGVVSKTGMAALTL
jgi:hypothetical protein